MVLVWCAFGAYPLLALRWQGAPGNLVFGTTRFCLPSGNGVGVTEERAQQAGQSGHFGMLGMRERAQRIGAQFSIDGHSGMGTRVSLRIKSGIAYARYAG